MRKPTCANGLVWNLVLFILSTTALFGGADWCAAGSTPVVSQVHVVSVHVQDHAAFDGVFLFCRDVLKLPLVYGELSKPGNAGQRLYAGFSVGNSYLEPCGPYKTDAPFIPAKPARFHGLTFSPAASIAEAAAELGLRKITHSEVNGSADTPRFVYLSDALLTGKKQAVSIWEIQNQNDRVNLDFLKSSLRAAKGGALGVLRMEEIRVEFPGETNRVQWANFLSPAKHDGDVWFDGNGPMLRLVPGSETRIESIVLKVESLERAKTVLSQKSLVGKLTRDSVEINPAKTWGLRIILSEKKP